ncbi:MAG: alpha/beta hydrolase, partial [Alphaproteobacteria bacterium]
MSRLGPIVCLCLALAACGPVRTAEPVANTQLPPHLSAKYWAPEGWGWGVLRVNGKPSLRYGVASPPGMSAGQIIIMTGYGETAEGWFETARFLVDKDYSVWVLEAAGQGGSDRYDGPRDQGQAPDFEADVEGVRALSAAVIRPRPSAPISVIASGTAAPAAITA